MSEKLFTTIKAELLECNKFPERVKEILNTANNSLAELDENDVKQFWILLHDFIKETSVVEDTINDTELLACYQSILNMIVYVINCAPEMLDEYEGYPMKTITLFQYLYSKQIKYKFKLEIVKMYIKLWQFISKLGFDEIAEHFIFTFNFIFDTIKVTTKKCDMKTLSTLLWEFCKGLMPLSSNQTNLLNLIVSNLEVLTKCSLFLETETGKKTIADIFTANQQLFLRLHEKIKTNLSKSNKLETEAYGEIYFIAWINSNVSIREIIEQRMFDIISKTFVLKRTGLALRTYRNALIFLQSMQYHRKHLLFSKVITKLYAPVLWRQLMSEFSVIRCNAADILARAYPLEKRGEGREVSSRFLIKQQSAFLNLLEDRCPQVRIAAIKGICSCMRYFWDTFEDEWIHKYFKLFAILIDENVYEVRRNLYYGFCQLLDECKSHNYFKNPLFISIMKNSINDDNEKVRRAFIHFLLKIKKIDNQLEHVNKINFAKIVNLQDTASALAREDKQNGTLLVDLIFDNFIGDRVPNKNATLMRFNLFYKINPTSFRKLILYSKNHLDFNSAYELILSLLRTVYHTVKKKEECLKNTDKENNSPAQKRKKKDDSENLSDSTHSSCYSSDSSNDENEQNEHSNVCCILDCVYCLMFIHHNALIDEKNKKQKEEINGSCTSCLIKLLKFYKEGDAYFSAMNLASLISATKLSVHLSVPSTAISTLKLLPNDINQSEEVIDMRKVNCLINTLCMWNRGYEILQFVNVWFNEAFKTLNLNETQYPEAKTRAGKRVRFKAEECKPLTGILLINSMLLNPQTRNTLMNSDVNKNSIYDLFSYLQRVEAAIENRITSDSILNQLLSDEVLIELFILKMRLHIIYYSHEKTLSVDEIIKFLTSTLDWANNLLIYDLHLKDETTITFAVLIIEAINNKLLDCCLMKFVNNIILEKYFSFCTTILNNCLGPRVLISMIKTLVIISNHLYYQKQLNKLVNDISTVTDCICRIISLLGDSKYEELSFKSIIGDPTIFRHELAMLILEINKINAVDFKNIFMILIETIINIINNKYEEIDEVDEVDVNELLTKMPFAAYQLTAMILNNTQLRNHFSSNALIIFSYDKYKNVMDCVLLLSSISFIYTLSFQIKKTKVSINLEPVVKLLYKTLAEFNKRDVSVLETSNIINHQIVDFQRKGRTILVSTAKQLRINLTD